MVLTLKVCQSYVNATGKVEDLGLLILRVQR